MLASFSFVCTYTVMSVHKMVLAISTCALGTGNILFTRFPAHVLSDIPGAFEIEGTAEFE